MKTERKDGQWVDVRSREEYDSGHIAGARLLPLDQLEQRAGEILPDKNAVWQVYCQSGFRSELAAKQLQHMGYTQVINFGSIANWKGRLTTKE
ncbi:MAG: rhodanese-like domain-containing protein [Lachnospiraceae bacterium]